MFGIAAPVVYASCQVKCAFLQRCGIKKRRAKLKFTLCMISPFYSINDAKYNLRNLKAFIDSHVCFWLYINCFTAAEFMGALMIVTAAVTGLLRRHRTS